MKLDKLKRTAPLIHCITNPISINQCANAVLCMGARPIMAEHPDEVREITVTAAALMLNTANITDARMKSMLISAQTAYENGIPFVIDAVGTACSEMRRRYVLDLIGNYTPSVIKGNASEINALYDKAYTGIGIDSDSRLTIEQAEKAAVSIAESVGCTVLVSGKTDIVTDGKRTAYVKNGCPQLSQITGTGCMLGAVAACFLAVEDSFEAAVTACGVMGICGELSQTEKGSGSFMVRLMDNLSALDVKNYEEMLRL